ncbi:uncharacterized protein F4812DRAFT_432622 [Daldinia caldariorum]|uniref:uncharacterized protein n=1 Tax=Daldinia caldariorum TaxID=326644 RepID=UPI0020088173|nr:uncharacterized protein F4812DRAFT_432622 [Daldinia caldariorum]KAI1466738.1 hypothetical protein F4812DRAFT_432622 [Daldinia caldariorum]
MDPVRHRLDRSYDLRLPELTYSHAVPSSDHDHRVFRAVQDPLSLGAGTGAGARAGSSRRGLGMVQLSLKWCDHRIRGCPFECDSKRALCERCEDKQCGVIHG